MSADSRYPRWTERLEQVSRLARQLFAVIVEEADHGPLRPKPENTTTPAEVLGACGLDVSRFYELLEELQTAGLIQVAGAYPLEEIRLIFEDAQDRREE